MKVRWCQPSVNHNSDWFKLYVTGITYSYTDTIVVREWYIRPTSPDTLYSFFPGKYSYGVGFVQITHLDSLNNESERSNKAFFRMTFGAPVLIDLKVVD